MFEMQSPVIAILCSDIHLRHTVPSARTDKSWYPVMEKHLNELRFLAKEHNAPIICAGDVFDRWNPPAELVSWAIDFLPKMYAIPGQHDLDGHSYDRKMDGAYGALVKAGIIIDMPAERWTVIDTTCGKIAVWSQPWGHYDMPVGSLDGCMLNLLVMHKYVYDCPAHAYVGAPDTGLVKGTPWEGFDAILSGDNHIMWHDVNKNWLNPGSLMAMKRDQITHCPTVGFLGSCGLILRRSLFNCMTHRSDWNLAADNDSESIAGGVLEALGSLENGASTFEDRVLRAAENAAKEEVGKILREVWEKVRK